MNIIVVASGGLDSGVLYHSLLHDGHNVLTLNFQYGSKHNKRELAALRTFVDDPIVINIDLSFIQNSSLMSDQVAVPTGNYSPENLKNTIVPFRNGVMLAYATSLAEERGFEAVAIGNHINDHAVYPDCTTNFVNAMSNAMQYGTSNSVQLLSPFDKKPKADIVKRAAEIGILDILPQTFSCYNGGEIHCGVCSTCHDRKNAFISAGVKDETVYEQ